MEAVHGRITVAPEVLHTIVRLTVLGLPGVMRLCAASSVSQVGRPFKRNTHRAGGIRITLDAGTLNVEIHLSAAADINMHELGQRVQNEVRRALEEMVGMDVRCVDVHIGEVLFAEREQSG